MTDEKRVKGNPAHERGLENARETLSVGNGDLVDKCWDRLEAEGDNADGMWRVISREQLAEAMLDAVRDFRDFGRAAQSEVPMEDQRPLDENVQRLIDQHEALGSHRALAQSLTAMAAARAADGAEGHSVIARRAARFVRVMAMQVTRFLAQPDLRLCHPKSEVDLSVTACTINDGADVQVMCTGDDNLPAPTYPLHELVAAGPIADMSRIMAQVMARTMVQDAIGQLIERGNMPGLDHLTATHGLDFSELATGGEVKGRPYIVGEQPSETFVPVGFEPPPGDEAFQVPSDSAWQPLEQQTVEPQEVSETFKRTVDDMGLQLDANSDPVHVHNLTAHAGYVLGEDGRTKPEDLPLDGQ